MKGTVRQYPEYWGEGFQEGTATGVQLARVLKNTVLGRLASKKSPNIRYYFRKHLTDMTISVCLSV